MKHQHVGSPRRQLCSSDATNRYKSNETLMVIPGSLANGFQQGHESDTNNRNFGSRRSAYFLTVAYQSYAQSKRGSYAIQNPGSIFQETMKRSSQNSEEN